MSGVEWRGVGLGMGKRWRRFRFTESIFIFCCEEKVWRGENAPLPNANVAVVAEHGSDDSSNFPFPATNNITTTTDERNQRLLIDHPLYEIHIIYTSTTAAMSWAGFKKNVNRATTQVMMKTGHVEKTNDRDYEVEER
jgi:hypothetical protein